MNNIKDTLVFENNSEVILKNNELKNYIQYKLNKNNIEIKDLDLIEDIILDGRKMNGDINIVEFDEINLFSNLKKIEIKNLCINKNIMNKLQKLDEINFKNCELEGIDEIKNVRKISINNCQLNIEEVKKLKELQEIELINISIEEFEFLKELEELRTLKMKNIKGFNLDKIDFILPITYLSVESLDDLDENYILKNYPNLETLSIEIEKEKEWKDKLDKIIKQGIKILLNDIYEY